MSVKTEISPHYTVILGHPSDWQRDESMLMEAQHITSLNAAIRIADAAHAKAPAGCLHYTVYRCVFERDPEYPRARCWNYTPVYGTEHGHL